MNNRFFKYALGQASRLAGSPGRILKLLTQLSIKLYRSDFQAGHIREKASTLSRMAAAFARGQYKNIPWKALLNILAALLYFLNPFDLIPDVIPGLGLTDDFAVLVWVYGSLNKEIEKFLEWERSLVNNSVELVRRSQGSIRSM